MLELFSLDLNDPILLYYITAITGKAVQCPLEEIQSMEEQKW